MAKFNDKISTLISGQLPEFVIEQHPKFATFLKTYYQLLESAELTVEQVEATDGILLETETNQENLLILDGGRLGSSRTQLDAGDKVLTEDTAFGKFENGETITGATSKATATIVAEDLDNVRLFVTSQSKFVIGETIDGSVSGARAVIKGYKSNPVQNISELVNYRDPDMVISRFLTQFRNEFLATLPEELANGVDKRKLIKNIKSLYQSKGSAEGNRIFFNLLFNEKADTLYPRENILRVSDGQFATKKIIRGIDVIGDTSLLVGRTITGETSNATAIVENVFRYSFGTSSVTEFVVNSETIEGTFQIGETLQGTESAENDLFIKVQVTGIPGTKNITNDGALYDSNATISLTGGGQGALFQVGTLGSGPLTEIIIDDGGFDFDIGDNLVFTNDETSGTGAEAFVSVVNGGFAFETPLARGDTQFIEDATQSVPDPTTKYLSGPVIAHDGITYKPTLYTDKLLGTISIADDSVTGRVVTGTGTIFTSQLKPGDILSFDTDGGTGIFRTVASIQSNTQLTLTADVTVADRTANATFVKKVMEFGNDGEIRRFTATSTVVGLTAAQQTNTRVSISGGSGKGAWGFLTHDGSSAMGTASFTLMNGGTGYSASDTGLFIPSAQFGGSTNLTLPGIEVYHGTRELSGTINTADGGNTDVSQVTLLTGQTSGATATIRYSVAGTTQADEDFNKNVLYITYTGNDVFQKGELVTVTLSDSSQFTIRLSATFGREGVGTNREGIDETNIADRDSVFQMVRALGLNIEEDEHLILEDETQAGDRYSGDKIVQERNTGIGDITDIFLVSGGQGYKSLPTIGFTNPDGSSTSSGKDFILKCFGTEIGRILDIRTIEHGIQHELSPTPPSIEFINNSIIRDVAGAFTVGETVTGVTSGFTAEVNSYDAARGLLKLDDVTGSPQVNEIINGGTSGAQATLHVTDHAAATVNVVSISDTDGSFLNEDGWVSENTMKIQDSLYYQDFSYVIKVGESINTWRNSFAKTMHSAGFYFSGEVAIESRLNLRTKAPVVGEISGVEESPILGILTTIFATNFRRKLGTASDGTTLRTPSNINHGGLTNRPSSSTRDLTASLVHAVTNITSRIRRQNVGGIRSIAQGFAYAGPTYESINKYHNTAFLGSDRLNKSNINFATLSDIRVIGTGTNIDGTPAIFKMISSADARKMKTNFTFPADITSAGAGSVGSSFDNNTIQFSSTNNTFDETP